jgi:translation initiation factor 5A
MRQELANETTSDTYPIEAGQIKKGGYIIIEDQPCKVFKMSIVKSGKHGCAKCHFFSSNIFTNKKLDYIASSSHSVKVPVIVRTEYTLNNIADDDGYLSLLDDKGIVREDLQLPCYPLNIANEIKTMFEKEGELLITVMKACGCEQICSYKKAQ